MFSFCLNCPFFPFLLPVDGEADVTDENKQGEPVRRRAWAGGEVGLSDGDDDDEVKCLDRRRARPRRPWFSSADLGYQGHHGNRGHQDHLPCQAQQINLD